jgi:hypothetical protein
VRGEERRRAGLQCRPGGGEERVGGEEGLEGGEGREGGDGGDGHGGRDGQEGEEREERGEGRAQDEMAEKGTTKFAALPPAEPAEEARGLDSFALHCTAL